jgi:hypothetical protein
LSLTRSIPEKAKLPEGLISQTRHAISQNIGSGIVTISTQKRRYHIEEQRMPRVPDFTESSITKVKYVPHSRAGSMFTTVFEQLVTSTQAFNLFPQLQVNQIRPKDSLVFQLVKEGRLDDFKEVLNRREASLRDHDDLGNSLLAVSILRKPLQILIFFQ